MLELFNINRYPIEVPKYGYEGKYTIPGKSFVDIEEDKAAFFKPYSAIGAVVRTKVVVDEVKEEVNEVKEEVKEEKVVASPIVDDVPVTFMEEDIEPETEEVVEEEKEPLYTEESLRYKGLYELREIADSMGIEVNTRKKEDIRKMILDSI